MLQNCTVSLFQEHIIESMFKMARLILLVGMLDDGFIINHSASKNPAIYSSSVCLCVSFRHASPVQNSKLSYVESELVFFPTACWSQIIFLCYFVYYAVILSYI